MVPCVSAMGRALLITLVGSLGNGSYFGPPQDLFLGVVFYSLGLLTHIRLFGPDLSIKVRSVGPLVLSPSSCSSFHQIYYRKNYHDKMKF